MSIGASKAAANQGANTSYGVFISPGSLEEFSINGSKTSAAVTAGVTGGVAPFIYSWVRISGATFNINSPSGSSTTFTGSGANEEKSGVFRVTVTDNALAVVEADITVTFNFFEFA